jgi:hypothetical protein
MAARMALGAKIDAAQKTLGLEQGAAGEAIDSAQDKLGLNGPAKAMQQNLQQNVGKLAGKLAGLAGNP